MTIKRFGTMTVGALLLGLLLCEGPSQARAGSLDKALLGRKTGDILGYLKVEGYSTVGVLPFKVQKGTREASYAGAPLAMDLPRRLENALIMTMGPNEVKAIGIIKDATGTANKSGVGSYSTSEAAFKKLFAQHYNLAWGGKTDRADAFLTGTVINEGDRSKTRVKIDLFDAKSWNKKDRGIKPVQSWTIVAPTDRMLLADLGYNFALSRSAFARSKSPAQRDYLAREQVDKQDQQGDKTSSPGQSGQKTPDNCGGFAFELHYNGVKQELKPITGKQGSSMTEYEAPPAMPGTAISLFTTRLDEENRKLGLVLMVNGQSTWKQETGDPNSVRRWIFDAATKGKREEYKGFYTDLDGKNLLPFKVLTAEESVAKAAELGNHAGWIHLHVFHSMSDQEKKPDTEYESQMTASTRGVPRGVSRKASLKEVRTALLKSNHIQEKMAPGKFEALKREVGGLILHELEPVEGGKLPVDMLPNPELKASIAIRYWDRGGRKVEQQTAQQKKNGTKQ